MLESLHRANLDAFMHLHVSPGTILHFYIYLFMYVYGFFFLFASGTLDLSS